MFSDAATALGIEDGVLPPFGWRAPDPVRLVSVLLQTKLCFAETNFQASWITRLRQLCCHENVGGGGQTLRESTLWVLLLLEALLTRLHRTESCRRVANIGRRSAQHASAERFCRRQPQERRDDGFDLQSSSDCARQSKANKCPIRHCSKTSLCLTGRMRRSRAKHQASRRSDSRIVCRCR